MRPTGVSRGGRTRALAVVLPLAGLLAAGCASPRNALGTSSSPCYRAVPVASHAVHDHGSLAGVRLVGLRDLDRHPHIRDYLSRHVGHALRSVCVVSFHGEFHLDQVEKPLGHAPPSGTGRVAIVVVSSPGNSLIGTFVLDREPLPLRHTV